eukprot:scpid85591/ scgid35715/ 
MTDEVTKLKTVDIRSLATLQGFDEDELVRQFSERTEVYTLRKSKPGDEAVRGKGLQDPPPICGDVHYRIDTVSRAASKKDGDKCIIRCLAPVALPIGSEHPGRRAESETILMAEPIPPVRKEDSAKEPFYDATIGASGLFFVHVLADKASAGRSKVELADNMTDGGQQSAHMVVEPPISDGRSEGTWYRAVIQAAKQVGDQLWYPDNAFLGLKAKSIPPANGVATDSAGLQLDVVMVSLVATPETPVMHELAMLDGRTWWYMLFDDLDEGKFTLHASFDKDVYLCRQGSGTNQRLILCPKYDMSEIFFKLVNEFNEKCPEN